MDNLNTDGPTLVIVPGQGGPITVLDCPVCIQDALRDAIIKAAIDSGLPMKDVAHLASAWQALEEAQRYHGAMMIASTYEHLLHELSEPSEHSGRDHIPF